MSQPDSPASEAAGRPCADAARLASLVPRLAGRRILVLADVVADEFVHTEAPRVSREAPVLILRYLESIVVPGGGANAAANIASLGGVPVVVGEVGDDDVGHALILALAQAGADVTALVARPGLATPRKTRILGGDKHVARQQVLRLDRIQPFPHDPEFLREVQSRVVSALGRVDGVLISDYGLGFVDPEWVEALVLRSPARAGLKVSLDSRYRLFEHRGVDVATPSEPELEAALGVELTGEQGRVAAGREALARLDSQALLLTRGSQGLVLFRDGEVPDVVPAFGSGTVADVTGAGDTVIATFSLALAAGLAWGDAARLANAAAGIAVTKMGTATVSAQELQEALTRAAGQA